MAAAALGLSEVVGALREGQLAGLGIAAPSRSGAYPDMPALNEAGLPLSAVIIRGLAAPARLPRDLAAAYAGALQAVAADEEFQQQAQSDGFRAVWIDGAAWTAQVVAERERLAKLWASEPWLSPAGQ